MTFRSHGDSYTVQTEADLGLIGYLATQVDRLLRERPSSFAGRAAIADSVAELRGEMRKVLKAAEGRLAVSA